MGIGTFYLTKTTEGKFGSVFYLKQLQEATSSGGGRNLLGSAVQWISEHNPFEVSDYPIPQVMTQPRAILSELEKRKAELGLEGDMALQIKVAAGTEKVKMEKKTVFETGVGPFPSLPVSLGLDIDYSRVKNITITFGADTFSEFIPTGYLAALFTALKGKPTAAMGGAKLKAFINQIVMAKNYSVNFESTEKFDATFEAKLKAFNQLPDVGGKVQLKTTSERTVKAEVSSGEHYVVGVTSTFWKDLK